MGGAKIGVFWRFFIFYWQLQSCILNCIRAIYLFTRKESKMSRKLFHWIVVLIVILVAVSASIIRVEGAPMTDGAQTSVASTLQAIFTPQNTEAPQSLLAVTPTVTPASLPTDAATPTDTIPMLILRDATNCRTGPGQAYEIIVTYPINQVLEIAGRHESDNFWLVKSAESPTGTCWLWGEYADVLGSYPAVHLVTPPPTVALPRPPTLHEYKYNCDDFNYTLSLNLFWNDKSDNESGYRIFRDRVLVAELSASSTFYSETIPMPANRSVEYFVQVYNAIGSAEGSFVKLICD
jgi:hypothetical protein